MLSNLLFREKKHALIVSNTEGQARDFLKNISLEIAENEEIKKLFKPRFIKDTDTEIIVALGNDGHKFRLLAKGSNQRVRGLLWAGTRPDLIVCDDMENDDIVMNQERRDKFRQWFFNALMPCLSDNGIIRIVGTILHLDSLLERLMPKEDRDRKIKVIKTPLADFSNDKNPQWKSVRFRAHDPTFANILWPEKFTKDRLLRIKQDYVDQGFPEGYAQEYLNYPIDEGSAYFRRADLLPMSQEDLEKNSRKEMKYYVGGDLAISKESYADYTALVVIGVDDKDRMHVVDVRKGRWDTFQIIEEIFSIFDRYHPELYLFEKGAIWSSIEPVFLKEMYRPGQVRDINYDTIGASKDKLARNRSAQHRTRAGAIYFDKESDWFLDLEAELVQFPRGAHDDQVDALGHICAKIVDLNRAPTQQERAEEERSISFKRSGLHRVGRCRVTGY
jgi:predicted phage terminase large subunit-like protein